LINQFYVVAQVPSILYGQSNIANVSEVSLELLFNSADNLSKKTAFSMIDGFNKRTEYISKLMGMDLSSVSANFNFNRPVDNSSLISDIKEQIEMGIMSKETAMRISPYIVDVEEEIKLLKKNVLQIDV
ncbi:MAG: phage portal protein, partial [Lacrimispora sphenoides]